MLLPCVPTSYILRNSLRNSIIISWIWKLKLQWRIGIQSSGRQDASFLSCIRKHIRFNCICSILVFFLNHITRAMGRGQRLSSPLNVAGWAAGKLLLSDKAAVSAPWPEQKSSSLLAQRPAQPVTPSAYSSYFFLWEEVQWSQITEAKHSSFFFFPLKKVKKITYHFAESRYSYILPLFYKEISSIEVTVQCHLLVLLC